MSTLDIEELLKSKGREFWREIGAHEQQIQSLQSSVRHPLPELYLHFLRYSNGGYGPLEVQPYTFVCYPITEVIELSKRPDYAVWLRDFVVIGGDGGGDFIVLDYRLPIQPRVTAIDMVNNNLDETLHVAPDFESFLRHVGIESPELESPQGSIDPWNQT